MINKALVIVIVCFGFISCNNTKPTPVTESIGQLEGYEIEQLEDKTAIAVKKDGGKIVERGMVYNGFKNGSWTTYYDNGEPHMITGYINGDRNGVSLEFDKNGRLSKVSNFANDQLYGYYKEMVSYIPQKEAHYKNGEYHGLYTEYNEFGKKFRDIEFVDGKQHGKMRYYDDNNNVTTVFKYENGEKISGEIIK